MPSVNLRWKGKDGEFLPEVGREDERDMRVEVVHYSPLEECALEACSIEQRPEKGVGFSIAGACAVLASADVYDFSNTFSIAFEMGRNGMSMQREPWEEGGIMVRFQFPDEHSKMTEPYLYMLDENGHKCPYLPSFVDMVAEDWRVL